MRYKVCLKKSDEGYAIWCPSLPGCCSQGYTREEALSNIEEAIEDYLSVLEEINQGEEIDYVEVGLKYA
jgi:predicted RNase H-like HicB family nuclease